MKRTTKLFALMISLVLLVSCGNSNAVEGKFTEFRESLASAPVSFTAEVTASSGSEVKSYTLAYTEDGGIGSITVLMPELIAGVTAKVSTQDGAASMEFDGVILQMGKLADDGLTPISALPALVTAMRAGHVSRLWTEKRDGADALAADIAVSDVSTATVWLDYGTLSPVYAEIRAGEKVVVQLTFQ